MQIFDYAWQTIFKSNIKTEIINSDMYKNNKFTKSKSVGLYLNMFKRSIYSYVYVACLGLKFTHTLDI